MSEVRTFDLRDEPCALAPEKWSRSVRRDPSQLRGVALHQWASPVGTALRERRRWRGEEVALARRALAAPYAVSAGVTSAGVPVVAVAHPLERYTHASDAGNREWLAVGIMGLFPFDVRREREGVTYSEMSLAMEAAIGAALDMAQHLLSEAGAGGPPWPLVTHRQCANGPKDHYECPGEAVIAAALRSPVVRAGVLLPDADLVLDERFGRPWPGHWRRHLQAPQQTTLDLAAVT